MKKLYIVVNDEGTYLVNLRPDNAEEMKGRGWKLYDLGQSRPDLVPGLIGKLSETTGLFEANKDQVAL